PFEGLAHNGIDALPIAADVACRLDATGAGGGRAFSQPERLVVESVYNVGDTDFFGGPAQRITAAGTTRTLYDFVLSQRFQHLAHDWLSQPERRGEISRAEHTPGVGRHMGQHQRAVVDDLAH